jgi:DNA modification methylase
LPEEKYQEEQIKILTSAAKKLKNDGVLIYNHKPRRRNGEMIHPMIWLSKVDGLTLMEEIIWDRGSTHNHSDKLFWPHTERLYVFRRTDGTYRLKNNDSLKFRSDVWRIPLTTRPSLGHAAPFPTPLAEAVLQAFARKGDLVCDPYSGSGTTAVAAALRGCDFIGSEIDNAYHRASVKRAEEVMNNSNVIQFVKKAS